MTLRVRSIAMSQKGAVHANPWAGVGEVRDPSIPTNRATHPSFPSRWRLHELQTVYPTDWLTFGKRPAPGGHQLWIFPSTDVKLGAI